MNTITKIKEVVTEQIELKEGVYLFDRERMYKFTIKFNIHGWIHYTKEVLTHYNNQFGISFYEDDEFRGDDLPYELLEFLRDGKGESVTEETWEKERTSILNLFNSAGKNNK